MSALLEEDDLLFEVDFDTETLEQLHSVYEKDRFPSEDRVEQLANDAAKRMESTDEGASAVDAGELQRRVREWFSKERTKDAKNGKVSCASLVGDTPLIALSNSRFQLPEPCRQNTVLSATPVPP